MILGSTETRNWRLKLEQRVELDFSGRYYSFRKIEEG